MELDSHKLLAGSGVAADNAAFSEYVQKNLKLYELNNDVKLSSNAAANFIRGEVSALQLLSLEARPKEIFEIFFFLKLACDRPSTWSKQIFFLLHMMDLKVHLCMVDAVIVRSVTLAALVGIVSASSNEGNENTSTRVI